MSLLLWQVNLNRRVGSHSQVAWKSQLKYIICSSNFLALEVCIYALITWWVLKLSHTLHTEMSNWFTTRSMLYFLLPKRLRVWYRISVVSSLCVIFSMYLRVNHGMIYCFTCVIHTNPQDFIVPIHYLESSQRNRLLPTARKRDLV